VGNLSSNIMQKTQQAIKYFSAHYAISHHMPIVKFADHKNLHRYFGICAILLRYILFIFVMYL